MPGAFFPWRDPCEGEPAGATESAIAAPLLAQRPPPWTDHPRSRTALRGGRHNELVMSRQAAAVLMGSSGAKLTRWSLKPFSITLRYRKCADCRPTRRAALGAAITNWRSPRWALNIAAAAGGIRCLCLPTEIGLIRAEGISIVLKDIFRKSKNPSLS